MNVLGTGTQYGNYFFTQHLRQHLYKVFVFIGNGSQRRALKFHVWLGLIRHVITCRLEVTEQLSLQALQFRKPISQQVCCLRVLIFHLSE